MIFTIKLYGNNENTPICILVFVETQWYVNCFNKRQRQWSPSTHVYSPSQGHDCIFTVYYLKKKQKKPSIQMLEFCVMNTILFSIILSISNIYIWKDNHTLNCMLSKDNSIITLFQSIIICFYMNSERINSYTLSYFNFCCNIYSLFFETEWMNGEKSFLADKKVQWLQKNWMTRCKRWKSHVRLYI
jgi:hypothetical protein